MDRVLFICTGNFYRSRFAEAVFNHHASRRRLPWRAFSRGLAVHLADGPISPLTLLALQQLRIPLHHTAPDRAPLRRGDLEAAARVIALKEAEHRPLLREQFPDWEDRVTYWHVHDLDAAPPEEALAEIELRVRDLVDRLQTEAAPRDQSP